VGTFGRCVAIQVVVVTAAADRAPVEKCSVRGAEGRAGGVVGGVSRSCVGGEGGEKLSKGLR
jgi:hypothetical protein